MLRQGRWGKAGLVVLWRGPFRQGRQGKVRRGKVRHGKARLMRYGGLRQAWRGQFRYVAFGYVEAGLGAACKGEVG
jgi:hypothetical protein